MASPAKEEKLIPLLNSNEEHNGSDKVTSTLVAKDAKQPPIMKSVDPIKTTHKTEDNKPKKNGDAEAASLLEKKSESTDSFSVVEVRSDDGQYHYKPVPRVDVLAARAGKAITTAQRCSSGNYLPLCTDKVRNNVRSRPVLALVYAVGAAVVALIAVLTFYRPQVNKFNVLFSLPPVQEITLGTQIPRFTVQVTDADNKGVSGEKLILTMLPIAEFDVLATVHDDQIVARSIACVSGMLLPASGQFYDDKVFCNPSDTGRGSFLCDGQCKNQSTENIELVSDDHGFATFQNLTLAFGAITQYMMIIFMESHAEYYAYSFFSVTAKPLSLTFSQRNPFPLKKDGRKYGEWHVDDSFDFDVGVTFQMSSSSSPPLLLGSVAAVLMVLNIANNDPSNRNFSPFPLVGPRDKIVRFVNGAAVTSTFFEYAHGLFNATLSFRNVKLPSVSSKQIYLGVSCLGMTIPILSTPTTSTHMTPQSLLVPFTPMTNVSSVFASASFLGTGIVAEKIPLNVEISVIDNFGRPVQGKRVFLYTTIAQNNTGVSGPCATSHPAVQPKALLFDNEVTDQHGTVTLQTYFSCSGAVGFYELHASCDGVDAAWGISGEPFALVDVRSSIDPGQCVFSGAGFAESSSSDKQEYVGVEWEIVPSLQLYNSKGDVVPGKEAQLIADEVPGLIGIYSTSLPSNDRGWLYFTLVKVGFATAERMYRFNITVDGMTIHQFTRMINFTDDAQKEKCTFVEILSFPYPIGFSGLPLRIDFATVNYKGDLLPWENIAISVLPVAQASTMFNLTFQATSEGSGIGSLDFPNQTITNLVAFPMTISCQDSPFMFSFVTAIFAPRIKKVNLTKVNSEELHLEFDAHWSVVNETYPLKLEAAAIWLPTYVTQFYGISQWPYSEAVIVTKETASLTLRLHLGSTPGTCIFMVVVDGTLQGQTLASTTLEPASTTLKVVSPIQGAPQRGVPFDGQPSVQFLSANESVAGLRVFAEIGIVDPNDGRRQWLDPWMNHTELQYGFLLANMTVPQLGLSSSLSSETDENGIANFTGLGLYSGKPGSVVAIRYCYVKRAVFESDPFSYHSHQTEITICVEEESTFSVDSSYSVQMSAQPSVVTATQGQFISDIFLELVWLSESSPRVELPIVSVSVSQIGVPRVEGAASPLVATSQFGDSNIIPPGVYTGAMGIVYVGQNLYFAQNAQDGNYLLTFTAAGGATAAVLVTLTSVATSLSFAQVPKSNVLVKRMALLSTSISAASIPMKGAKVELSIRSTDPGCVCSSCGILATNSIQYAASDSKGIAEFAIAMEAAESGKYVVSVKVAPNLSPVGIRQSISQQLTDVTATLGVPLTSLPRFVNGADPTALDTFNILDQLADLTSQILSQQTSSFDKIANLLPDLFSKSQQQKPIETDLEVVNEVNRTVIWALPDLNFHLTFAPVLQTRTNFTPLGHPIIQVIGADGDPLPNVSISIEVVATETDVEVFYPYAATTNEFGMITVTNLMLSALHPGTFQLFFSASGGGGNLTKEFAVSDESSISLSEAMEFAAALIVICFSPLMLAAVPYSSPKYVIIALMCCAVTAFWTLLAGTVFISSKGIFVKSYTVFTLALVGLLCGGSIIVSLLDILGHQYGFVKLRVVNDEQKGLACYKYVRWLLTVRIDKQIEKRKEKERLKKEEEREKRKSQKKARGESVPEELDGEEEEDPQEEGKMKESGSKRAKIMLKALADKPKELKRKLGKQIDDITVKLQLPYAEERRRRKHFKKAQRDRLPLEYDEENAPMPNYWPFNFLIVLSVSFILMVAMTMLMFYIYFWIQELLGELLRYLPSVPSNVETETMNDILMQSIIQVITVAATAFPSTFGYLTPLTGPLGKVNLISFLNKFRHYMYSIQLLLAVAFYSGVALGLIAVIVTAVMLSLRIPKLLTKMRRKGIQETERTVGQVEGYIGLHCMHFLMVYVLVFVLVFIVVVLLLVRPIRDFLIRKLSTLVVASGISYAIQLFLQKVLVEWFLAEGLHIIRPELYAVWHFAGLILGIFTGIMKSFTRWITSLVLVTFLFAKMDSSIFPAMFVPLDAAHQGFMSMVALEAVNGNPVYLCFATILLKAKLLRKLGRKKLEQQKEESSDGCMLDVVVDRFGEGEFHSSAVTNIAKIMLRSETGNPLALTELPTLTPTVDPTKYCTDEFRTSEKVKNRFWLLMLLHYNPSLKKMRKHYLFEVVSPTSTSNSSSSCSSFASVSCSSGEDEKLVEGENDKSREEQMTS